MNEALTLQLILLLGWMILSEVAKEKGLRRIAFCSACVQGLTVLVMLIGLFTK